MSEWIRKLAEGYKTVNENQKAALQKKLAKASASSEKPKQTCKEENGKIKCRIDFE